MSYKQAFSGIGWAALSRPSIIVSTLVFGNLAGDSVGGKAVFALGDPLAAEMAMMSGILRLTICRAMQITVLPGWVAESMNSNHEALVVLRGMGLFDRGGHEVKGPCLTSA